MMQMVVGINAKQHAQPMRMANGAQNKILMDVNQAGVTLEVSSLFCDYLINIFSYICIFFIFRILPC